VRVGGRRRRLRMAPERGASLHCRSLVSPALRGVAGGDPGGERDGMVTGEGEGMAAARALLLK
jgi:hypothetical protein